MIDNEIIRNLLMLLQWLTTCALAVYAHNIGKQRATTESIEKLKQCVEEKNLRITRLETELKTLPTKEKMEEWIVKVHDRINDINKVSAETNLLIGKLSGQVGEISKQLTGKHHD
jgi:septal ring factor EnvC (AmiA/AmiB activator)